MAWRTPLIIQGIPAVILSVGVWFMPFSPRLLMNKNREEEALRNLSRLRGLPEDHELVQTEFLEIKSEVVFERKVFARTFPNLKSDSIFRREIAQYANIFRTKDSFKRVAMAGLIMFFQQWSGIDSSRYFPLLHVEFFQLKYDKVIYYAPIIFQTLGLTGHTISLLATGVVGIINVAVTVPAILIIDKLGRRPLLLAGSTGMFLCQVIVGVIVATCQSDWDAHRGPGWAAVVMIWLYIGNFGYSWVSLER